MTEVQAKSGGDVLRIRRFFALLGVVVLLLSQFLVFSQPVANDTVILPPYTLLALVGVVILILSQFIPPTPFWEKISQWRIFDEQVFWTVAGFLFSALAAAATVFFALFTRVNYIPVITVWLLGAACYVYGFIQAGEGRSYKALIEWVKLHRNEIIAVALIMVFAAAVRFYKLGDIPRVMDGDEGAVGLAAQQTTSGVLANPFALWDNFGALYLQLINLSIKLFGVNSFALRLLPAIGGVLAVPAVYLLGRAIGGHRIGLVAAFLIAASHSHIHFSRIASVAYIQGTWLAPLELYLLYTGLVKRESWRTALGGITLAIDFSVYLPSQVIAGLVLVYMVIAFMFYRPWFKPRLAQAAAFWGGFLIAILPSALFIFQQPDQFFNRLNRDGTFQSGWLQNTMASTGQNAVQILTERIVHAFLSLIYFPAFDFYGSPAPMLSMISTVMFLAGLGIALWRLKSPGYLLLNGYFWAATVSIGLFAIPPSADSYRMLMAFPAAMIMAAIGLELILGVFNLAWDHRRAAYVLASSIVLASLLVYNLWTYYGEFAGKCLFGESRAGRFATYLGLELRNLDNEQTVYLLSDDIFFHGSHPSTAYLSFSRPVTNFPDPADTLHPISGDTIIAPPSRIPDLETWAHDHPGGRIHYEYDCDTEILMSYRVP